MTPSIAVLVPCLNEATTIAKVVADFRAALPGARVFVFDNGSSDATRENAAAAGASVRNEPRRGKGNVVRRMFADIDADFYVLVDGDDTYEPSAAPAQIARMTEEGLDFVNVARRTGEQGAFRLGHRFGNRALSQTVQAIFGRDSRDMLSGYKLLSRRYVKSFPATSSGFETETELTVHALELALPVAELDTPYYARPEGSVSKLNTYRDGMRILGTILKLYRSEKPLRFFTAIGVFLILFSIGLAIPIVVTYIEEGVVPRLPTAVLSMGLMILAMLSVASGLVLDTVTRGRREMKLLAYLSHPPVGKN